MKDRANTLPVAAAGISLAAHLLVLLLVPSLAPRLPGAPRRVLVPVRLLEQPPAPRAPGNRPSARQPAAPAAPTAGGVPARQEAPTIAEPLSAELIPAARDAPPPDQVAAAEGAPAAQQSPAVPGPGGTGVPAAAAKPGAEIAAYQLILSSLRVRIVEGIRYPVIARVNGWEGTVIVSVRLDAAGRLEQAIVRQSSGHEVLDRAAAALLKKVTPVENPLSSPITIEIPIVYELK